MIDQFEMWAAMIRSDQMPARSVVQFLEDHPDFAEWYLRGTHDIR